MKKNRYSKKIVFTFKNIYENSILSIFMFKLTNFYFTNVKYIILTIFILILQIFLCQWLNRPKKNRYLDYFIFHILKVNTLNRFRLISKIKSIISLSSKHLLFWWVESNFVWTKKIGISRGFSVCMVYMHIYIQHTM